MKLRSRKGLTLVELIVAVAFTAVVIAAACAVLYLGAHSFKSGTSNAVNQQRATLTESYLQRYAATAFTVSSSNDGTSDGVVFALSGSTLNVQKQTVSNGVKTMEPVVSVDGIARIKLNIVNGTLNYAIVSADETYTLEGGIVLNNVESGSVSDMTGENSTVLFFGTKQPSAG